MGVIYMYVMARIEDMPQYYDFDGKTLCANVSQHIKPLPNNWRMDVGRAIHNSEGKKRIARMSPTRWIRI
jgi:hypothetical protein